MTIQLSDHHQRRIDRAHRRLMATLRTLATVRRLGVPAIQVNVAPSQVNIAGTTRSCAKPPSTETAQP